MTTKNAIVSVYNKNGLAPFVSKLSSLGIEILSTGGTLKYLSDNGIKVKSISEYTGSPEILDGRVKTLHPKIHGGILARRDRKDDLEALANEGIEPIDYVIVNLYPFAQKVKEIVDNKLVQHGSQIELIDIGGPTMIRAAAKNCKFVVPICDPQDYSLLISELENNGEISYPTRQKLAAKVFMTMAAYDGEVARYFSLGEELLEEDGSLKKFAPVETRVLTKDMSLRYGENPHQQASYYRPVNLAEDVPSLWQQLQGKEISYNNLVDMGGALELFLEFYHELENEHVAVIIKHTNPCGVALRKSALEAFEAAKACDPVSAFGGIIAVSGVVDDKLAEKILADFVEIVLVSDITDGALELFKKKKNVRLIKCQYDQMVKNYFAGDVLIKNCSGGYLLQTADNKLAKITVESVICGERPDEAKLKEMRFAWKVCKHVKSNTIVVTKNLQAIGVGAGQMSRVDSARIAIQRAGYHGFDVKGGTAASDAFLPFADTLEVLNDAGVTTLVQPGGSIRDEDVIKVAKERNVTMAMTGERHFKH